jgi:hypothetical protein
MTNAFLGWFDRMSPRAFKGVGLCDDAYYTPSTGGPEVACSIKVDRGLQLQNAQTSEVISNVTTVTAYAADIGDAPKRGARFRIGTEILTVDSLSNADESRFVCIVKTGK